MSMQITLKVKPSKGDHIVPITLVKQGRSIEAKIYNPSKYTRGQYQISMNGCAFYRDTLETSLEFVRKSVEDRMNAFSVGSSSYVIVTLEGIIK